MLFQQRSRVHPTIGLASITGDDDPAAIVVPPTLPSIAATAAATCDLRLVYANPVLNQGEDEDCVWMSIREANDFVNRGAGAQVSPRGGWTDTRAVEGATIANTGCETTDAYSCSVSTGWRALDAADADPTKTNTRETPDEVVSRIRVPSRCFVPLADGDTDSIHRYATSNCPSTFTVWVGPKFQACNAQNPMWSGETSLDSSAGGYHRLSHRGYVLIGGVLCEIGLNHWSAAFGDGGYVYIPTTAFQKIAIEPVVHVGGIQL